MVDGKHGRTFVTHLGFWELYQNPTTSRGTHKRRWLTVESDTGLNAGGLERREEPVFLPTWGTKWKKRPNVGGEASWVNPAVFGRPEPGGQEEVSTAQRSKKKRF